MANFEKIGFGGGCHWCTEGVFQSLLGIDKVEQGWIASQGENRPFSEAVIVHFDTSIISLKDLIEIHLYTHSSTSNHSMRQKYRSAVYAYSKEQKNHCELIIRLLQNDFEHDIVTQTLMFQDFKLNKETYLNYLYTRPEASFCQTYIHPKLTLLQERFSSKLNMDKVQSLKI